MPKAPNSSSFLVWFLFCVGPNERAHDFVNLVHTVPLAPSWFSSQAVHCGNSAMPRTLNSLHSSITTANNVMLDMGSCTKAASRMQKKKAVDSASRGMVEVLVALPYYCYNELLARRTDPVRLVTQQAAYLDGDNGGIVCTMPATLEGMVASIQQRDGKKKN